MRDYAAAEWTKTAFEKEFASAWPWLAGRPARIGWALHQAGVETASVARDFYWHFDEVAERTWLAGAKTRRAYEPSCGSYCVSPIRAGTSE